MQHGTAGGVFNTVNNLAGVFSAILVTHDFVRRALSGSCDISANYTPNGDVTASARWRLVSAGSVLTHERFVLSDDSVNIGRLVFRP
jgi:hypothetical protein